MTSKTLGGPVWESAKKFSNSLSGKLSDFLPPGLAYITKEHILKISSRSVDSEELPELPFKGQDIAHKWWFLYVSTDVQGQKGWLSSLHNFNHSEQQHKYCGWRPRPHPIQQLPRTSLMGKWPTSNGQEPHTKYSSKKQYNGWCNLWTLLYTLTPNTTF